MVNVSRRTYMRDASRIRYTLIKESIYVPKASLTTTLSTIPAKRKSFHQPVMDILTTFGKMVWTTATNASPPTTPMRANATKRPSMSDVPKTKATITVN